MKIIISMIYLLFRSPKLGLLKMTTSRALRLLFHDVLFQELNPSSEIPIPHHNLEVLNYPGGAESTAMRLA